MSRALLLLGFILLPLALYMVYVRLVRRHPNSGTARGWMLAALCALVAALVMVFGLGVLPQGAPAGSVYTPPHFEDGQVAPSGFAPPKQ